MDTPRNCPKCGIEFCSSTRKFCSRKCANSRTWTEYDKIKKAHAAQKSIKVQKLKSDCINRICKCGKQFTCKPSRIHPFCSIECANKFKKKPPGGYRPGSGRSKSGYYKNIYCGSTYELCWVIYNLDHGINFQRFSGYLDKNGAKYYPDFLINDNIIEIKGYEKKDSVNKKTKLAESFGYKVTVLYRDDLKYAFEYVKKTYTPIFQTLYDDYKCNTYTCSHCHTTFSRPQRAKTEIVFCSRHCAGKGHIGRVKPVIPQLK